MKWFAWLCVFMLVAAVLFESSSAASQGKKDNKVGQVKNAASKAKSTARNKRPSRGRKNKGRRRDGEEDDGDLFGGDDEDEDDGDYSCFDPCSCFGWGGPSNARRHKRRNMKNRNAKSRNAKSHGRKH